MKNYYVVTLLWRIDNIRLYCNKMDFRYISLIASFLMTFVCYYWSWCSLLTINDKCFAKMFFVLLLLLSFHFLFYWTLKPCSDFVCVLKTNHTFFHFAIFDHHQYWHWRHIKIIRNLIQLIYVNLQTETKKIIIILLICNH